MNAFEHHSQQPAPSHNGSWALKAGRATTLQPQHAGVFRVTQGAVWATLDGPHAGHTQVQGDQFLQAGEAIPLQYGERLVIEPIATGSAAAPSVYFNWAYTEQQATQNSPIAVQMPWREGVAQPAHDLAQALRAAFGALGRLALGLAGRNTRGQAGLGVECVAG